MRLWRVEEGRLCETGLQGAGPRRRGQPRLTSAEARARAAHLEPGAAACYERRMTQSEQERARSLRLVAGLALGLLLYGTARRVRAACAPAPGAAVWPQFHHDSAHSGCSPFNAKANSGALKWSFPLAQYTIGSPVVGGDGTVYVTGGSLYAITPAGAQKWVYSLGGGSFDYSTVTPAIGPDGALYFGAYTGDFYAVNTAGALLWQLPLNGTFFDTSATSASGTIFVGDDLADGGSLLALNANTSPRWQAALDGDVYSIPAIFKGTAFITMNTTVSNAGAGLYELAASSGALLRQYKDRYLAMFNFSPAVDPTGAVYVIDLAGNLLKFAQRPGGLEWSVPVAAPGSYPDYWASPAVGPDGTIYVASQDGNLYSVSAAGALNWKTPLDAASHSSPAISADGIIFVGAESGTLYAINSDGSVRWTFTASGAIESAPALAADGTVFFAATGGTLYAID